MILSSAHDATPMQNPVKNEGKTGLTLTNCSGRSLRSVVISTDPLRSNFAADFRQDVIHWSRAPPPGTSQNNLRTVLGNLRRRERGN
jgi:hypothetical protein